MPRGVRMWKLEVEPHRTATRKPSQQAPKTKITRCFPGVIYQPPPHKRSQPPTHCCSIVLLLGVTPANFKLPSFFLSVKNIHFLCENMFLKAVVHKRHSAIWETTLNKPTCSSQNPSPITCTPPLLGPWSSPPPFMQNWPPLAWNCDFGPPLYFFLRFWPILWLKYGNLRPANLAP